MLNNTIEKPIKRGAIRKKLGKEYFIAKRKFSFLLHAKKYATLNDKNNFAECTHSIIVHRSFLLRPLKDVDMILQHNKTVNLRIAISHISGIILKPGKTLSIWKLVGRPTKKKGYLEGLVLHNGEISKGIGGGLCQLGNLLYWIALNSDLTITERWRHGFDVFPDINRKIPFGCGATLSYNYIDLQLTNNTKNTYKLNLWLDEEYLNGELLCNNVCTETYNIIEKDHFIKQQWWGGYTRHNKIFKQKINKDGAVIEEQLIAENHAIMMYNPLLEKKSNSSINKVTI